MHARSDEILNREMMRYSNSRFLSTWLVVLLAAVPLAAQEDPPPQYGDSPKRADRAAAIYKENVARYKDAADVLVLPGVIANRKERRVELLAETTGLTAETIVEFLLIHQSSERGYEALLWSMAKPSDVHKALVFIGMKPGKPFNPAQLRFWSKGERVHLSVAAKNKKSVRLESLIMDTNTGKPLAEAGFVFAGSFMTDRPGEKPGQVYAADFHDPRSVASMYSDPIAVLDVPRQARKGAVYGTQVVGPKYDFAANELVTILIESEYKDGRRRVKDLALQVRRTPGQPASPVAPIEFLLSDMAGQAMGEKRDLVAVLGVLDKLIRKGHDPYVSVRFGAALRLADIGRMCRILAAIDTESGIRVEPPVEGQLYYEAFLPDQQLRDRKNRIIQPWELHLTSTEDRITGVLELHETTWDSDASKYKSTTTTFNVDTPAALRRQLDADAARRKKAGRRPGPPIL
ncbi:MAG: hypothetical protein HQ581_13135, partial [Planctomycetes bacterium]|nr:hypothetical protein [Planctomycetota bacterium]